MIEYVFPFLFQASSSRPPWKCSTCGRSYATERNLKRHELTHKAPKPHKCTICSKAFQRNDSRLRHEKIHGSGAKRIVPSRKRKLPQRPATVPGGFRIQKTSTAFNGATVTWRIGYPAGNTGQDVADLLQKSTAAMKDKLLRYQKSKTAIKLNMTIIVMFNLTGVFDF